MADKSIYKRLFYTSTRVLTSSACVATGLPSCLLASRRRKRETRQAASLQLALKWVEGSNVELLEVSFISGRNNQSVHPRGRGDHRVFEQVGRLAMHNAGPFPKAGHVHGQHLIGGRQVIDPPLEFVGLRRVMTPRPLDPRLQFAQRYGGQKQHPLFHGIEPRRHRSVRTRLAHFGNYIRIEQVPIHSNSTTGRRRQRPLSGTMFSKRGSGANNQSFRLGRAAFWSRSHSSIGTRTAVLTPRRVTTCGPFLMAASSNSLKRAFASCTCQEDIFHLVPEFILLTSLVTSQQ